MENKLDPFFGSTSLEVLRDLSVLVGLADDYLGLDRSSPAAKLLHEFTCAVFDRLPLDESDN